MIKALLENININLDHVDETIKETVLLLLNTIEALAKDNSDLREQLQNLKDEINRLKGEQGKPTIKPNVNKHQDISSEKERKKQRTAHKKHKKNQTIKINRTQICELDKSKLPPDAKFKGYKSVIVQGLKIETDNVLYKKEVYYSLQEQKTYIAELPAGYEGGFDPVIKSLAIILKNICNTSESKIWDLFQNVGIQISKGTISNMLIKNHEAFHHEKKDLVTAGLQATTFQQIDDTKCRVNGQNYHTHILCSPYYTAYTTTEKKNRLTVIEVLMNGSELQYCLNQQAFDILEQLNIGEKNYHKLKILESEKLYSQSEFEELILPLTNQHALPKILEAAAIAGYRKGVGHPVVKNLLCDDAPQFKLICDNLVLCWVHDGRHYKKICPVVKYNAKKLTAFIGKFWDYYHKLLGYQKSPEPTTVELLSNEFDELFSTCTGYKDLDDRILKTKAKKENLLVVFKYPDIPLHNNAAELAARVMARKRDVSLHTMTEEGTRANDTFLSIVETCKKLGINPFNFIMDRITKKYQFPLLADMIKSISENNNQSLAFC